VNSAMLIFAGSMISLIVVCLTVLAALHVIQGSEVVHLATFVIGGVVGVVSPQMSSKTTSTPSGSSASERVG
jgi:hypothetical protein